MSFYFVTIVTEFTAPTVTFTLYNDNVNWATAKSRCEDRGQRLAVLDTAQRRDELQLQGM